jgi:Tfp pilus assembly protein PilO
VDAGHFAFGCRDVRSCRDVGNHDLRSRNRRIGRRDKHRNTMKQSSKRLISVFLAFAFILAAFISFFDLVQPAYSDAKALRSKQLGEENYLKDQTALVKQVQMNLTAYQNESQSAANIALAVPSGEDIAGALAEIEGIAANNGIVMQGVNVTPPVIQVHSAAAGEAASSSAALMKPLGSFTLKLVAAGSYESFKNFLSELETNIRIFDVKNVSLQPSSIVVVAGAKSVPSRDVFNYALTVATYYQMQ